METESPLDNPFLKAGGTELLLRELVKKTAADQAASTLTLRKWLELAETWRIIQALRDTGGNRAAAARALGIGRRTLYSKMEKLKINVP